MGILLQYCSFWILSMLSNKTFPRITNHRQRKFSDGDKLCLVVLSDTSTIVFSFFTNRYLLEEEDLQ